MFTYNDLIRLLPGGDASTCDVFQLAEEITELGHLAMVAQDPKHHAEGSVLRHTQMVVDELLALPAWRTLCDEDRFILFYGALFHDLGKLLCTVTEPDGSISSRGHSRKGAIAVRELLWLAEVPFAIREAICGLIATHQVPFHAFRPGAAPDYLVRRLSYQANLELLFLLAEADHKGRLPRPTASAVEELAILRDYAEEMGCLRASYAFPDDHTRVMYFRKEGKIPADSVFPRPRKATSQVILLSGLPASGKDTVARQTYPDLPVISYDAARAELNLKHGKHDGGATQLVRERVRECLRSGAPFVWNATHLSREMRGQALNLCYAYDAEVSIVYLEVSETEIRMRNKRRGYPLPDEAVMKMLHRWEPPLANEAHHTEWQA